MAPPETIPPPGARRFDLVLLKWNRGRLYLPRSGPPSMWVVSERLTILGLMIIVACGAGCERTVANKPTRMPLSLVVDSSKAEQREVLGSRGVPDRVWCRQFGVTVWAYCDQPFTPALVEFGEDGRILAEWRSANVRYCSDADVFLGGECLPPS